MPSTASLETAASHLDRLGPPPDDIARNWLEDAGMPVEAAEIEKLDPTDPVWETFLVDRHGRLFPSKPPSSIAEPAEPTEPTSLRRITDDDKPLQPQEHGQLQEHGQPLRRRQSPRRRRVGSWSRVFAGGVGIAILLGGFAWMRSPSASTQPPSRDRTSALATAPPTTPNPFVIDTGPRRRSPSGPGGVSPPLRTLESAETAESAESAELQTLLDDFESDAGSPSLGTDVLSGTVSLETWMPAADLSLPRSSLPDVEAANRTRSDDPSEIPTVVPESDTRHSVAGIDITETNSNDSSIDVSMQDDSLPVAIARDTIPIEPVLPQTTAVELASRPTNESSEPWEETRLLSPASPPQTLRLEFPIESDLELRATETPHAWTIHDLATGSTEPGGNDLVAEIRWADDNGLTFRWASSLSKSSPAKSATAKTLSDGRLVTDSGDIVYLRPQLEAEPIALNLVHRDEKLKWDLAAPILAGATRLDVQVEIPKDVQSSWIERIDAAAARNTRGIVMFTLKDAPESVAIVVRADIRTSNALSMRIRVGGRLDPSLPWQWTDANTIRQSLDGLTAQLQTADAQLLRLDAAISRAKKIRARRQEAAFEIQRDRIDETVRHSTAMAKRLAELDQLVALLDSDGRITAELTVDWPAEQSQTVLKLRPPPPADPVPSTR